MPHSNQVPTPRMQHGSWIILMAKQHVRPWLTIPQRTRQPLQYGGGYDRLFTNIQSMITWKNTINNSSTFHCVCAHSWNTEFKMMNCKHTAPFLQCRAPRAAGTPIPSRQYTCTGIRCWGNDHPKWRTLAFAVFRVWQRIHETLHTVLLIFTVCFLSVRKVITGPLGREAVGCWR